MVVTPRTFRIPFALRGGRPIHVSEVDSGFHDDWLCPECQKPLVAKKGTCNAHHFAHDGEHTCNGETILHLLAKQILKERIETAVAAGKSMPLSWPCQRCGNQHEGNLVKRTRSVRVEVGLDGKIPDLTLLDQRGEPCGVIEVIVTHAPDWEARAAYIARKIPIVEFRVETSVDLLALRDRPTLEARAVSYCPVPDWQLQTVTLAKLKVRLDQITIELRANVLVVLDHELAGIGEGAVRGKFIFDHEEQARLALNSLKSGAIDGLNEPEWMLSQCKNRFLHHDLMREITSGLREYKLEWRGFGKTKWRRPKAAQARQRRYY